MGGAFGLCVNCCARGGVANSKVGTCNGIKLREGVTRGVFR